MQQFCLKWKNHQSALISLLDALLERESFVDVTLAAEGKFIRVHRVVLCACSQYFEELLDRQTDRQPIVFLKDVRFSELRAIVDYMYKGEVNVSQDELLSFLNTAGSLKIKGLEDSQMKGQSFNYVVAQDKIQTPAIVSAPAAEVLANVGPGSVPEAVPVAESQLIVENAPEKCIPVPVSDHGSNISQSGSSQSNGDDLKVGVLPPEERMETEAAENNSADDGLTEGHSLDDSQAPDTSYSTPAFNRSLNQTNLTPDVTSASPNLNNTLKSKGPKLSCPICLQGFRLASSLEKHSKKKCSKKPALARFSCSKCQFRTDYLSNLRHHMQKQHEMDNNSSSDSD